MIGLAIVLVALALLRLGELYVSARNWKRHRQRASRPAEPLFLWMVVLHSSTYVLLPAEYLLLGHHFGGAVSWLAIALFCVALGLRVWTLKTIGNSWNVRVVGGPDYPIVDGGPYRFIRHPNYLVVMLELLFLPLIWQLWWSAALLSLGNLWVLSIRIPTEERMLAHNPQWQAKMAHKPRFIPGRRIKV